jgi:hypothetical protein
LLRGACHRAHVRATERVGWVERSDTHPLHLVEMMGFAGSTHLRPECLLALRSFRLCENGPCRQQDRLK